MAKKKQKNNFSELSVEELVSKAKELEEQLFKLKMQKETGQLANTALVSLTRKDLARVKTFHKQKANSGQTL